MAGHLTSFRGAQQDPRVIDPPYVLIIKFLTVSYEGGICGRIGEASSLGYGSHRRNKAHRGQRELRLLCLVPAPGRGKRKRPVTVNTVVVSEFWLLFSCITVYCAQRESTSCQL